MFEISLFVLPSYFMKKKTKKEVRGRDFIKALPIGIFSDILVTVAMISAEIRTFKVKYTILLIIIFSAFEMQLNRVRLRQLNS